MPQHCWRVWLMKPSLTICPPLTHFVQTFQLQNPSENITDKITSRSVMTRNIIPYRYRHRPETRLSRNSTKSQRSSTLPWFYFILKNFVLSYRLIYYFVYCLCGSSCEEGTSREIRVCKLPRRSDPIVALCAEVASKLFDMRSTARVNWPPHCPHGKNPEIGNFSIFRILTPNLISKVLY
jgi:hypothetical protein